MWFCQLNIPQESLHDTDRLRLVTYGPFYSERDETYFEPDRIYSPDSFIARPERSPNPHLCRICNTVVGAITNPLLALKTNLTDSCVGGSLSRLSINKF